MSSTVVAPPPSTNPTSSASALTLVETLRVLEVARGLRHEREVAEVALARDEIRSLMRKRLLDAAAVTGDKITESDIDAAIEQYFATQHAYADPPMSLSVFLAHLWIRRFVFAVGLLVLLILGLVSRFVY